MKEILKRVEEILEQERTETVYLENVLERLQQIKENNRPNMFADQHVS